MTNPIILQSAVRDFLFEKTMEIQDGRIHRLLDLSPLVVEVRVVGWVAEIDIVCLLGGGVVAIYIKVLILGVLLKVYWVGNRP